jgi:WD40 repeat protein
MKKLLLAFCGILAIPFAAHGQDWPLYRWALARNTSNFLGGDLSPDGQVMATISDGPRLRTWNVNDRSMMISLNLDDQPYGVAVSADGAYTAVSFAGNHLRLYWTYSGEMIWESRPAQSLGDVIYDVKFAPDGTRMYVCTSRGQVAAVSISGVRLYITQPSAEDLTHLAVSPSGDLLAVGGFDNKVKVLRATDGFKKLDIAGHTDNVSEVAFAPDKTIYSGSIDNTVRKWNPTTGAQVGGTINTGEDVYALAVSPDGTKFAVNNTTGKTKLYSSAGTLLKSATGVNNRYQFWTEFAPTGATLYSCGENGEILARNVADLSYSLGIGVPDEDTTSLAWLPNGQQIFSGHYAGQVSSWNNQTGAQATRRNVGYTVRSLAASPDGSLLAYGTEGNWIELYSTSTGAVTQLTDTGMGDVLYLEFSPDGSKFISISNDHDARLWRTADGAMLGKLSHTVNVSSASFSPNGINVATGDDSGLVRIWNAGTRAWVKDIPTVSQRIVRLKYSGDAKLLGVEHNDKIDIRIVATTATKQTFTADSGSFNDFDVAPDGDTLVSVDDGGYIHFWSMKGSGGSFYLNNLDFTPNVVRYSPYRTVSRLEAHKAE